MWNSPRLMNALANLLCTMATAAVLVRVAHWGLRQSWFPLREVALTSELKEVRRGDLERVLAERARGSFFSVDLDAMRASIEEISWVRRAEVRRQWPMRVEVKIEEHVPAAFWGRDSKHLVNTHGEVFSAVIRKHPFAAMPVLVGPTGLAPEMLQYYRISSEALKSASLKPRALVVSPRLALQIRLDDGTILELGRRHAGRPLKNRLDTFVEYYTQGISPPLARRPGVVDMRYPNGFALRVGAPAGSESRGIHEQG
ncbi:MAG: cell division protein FtsQ/DivIB [Candidatus Accumulibacter sp.]|jgi:cell division protein FtsQ|nr:cell division protein FtsQ/DivIB [Accumulibacter sp.]